MLKSLSLIMIGHVMVKFVHIVRSHFFLFCSLVLVLLKIYINSIPIVCIGIFRNVKKKCTYDNYIYNSQTRHSCPVKHTGIAFATENKKGNTTKNTTTKNMINSKKSHQCQIPGCQATYSTETGKWKCCSNVALRPPYCLQPSFSTTEVE